MPKTNYHLHLTGYVGGYDFDRSYVDYILGQNKDKEVNVLIDSLGGSLATALSIASASKSPSSRCRQISTRWMPMWLRCTPPSAKKG